MRLFWHKRSVDVAPKRQTEMKPRHAGEASRVHPGSAKYGASGLIARALQQRWSTT